ncbi:hypothetical protein [Nitrosomonas cryotolerans]
MGEHKMRISDVIRETGLSRNTVNPDVQRNRAKGGFRSANSVRCLIAS